MTEKSNVSILKDCKCEACDWPVIDVCCNGSFTQFKDADKWDWWYYCANKACKNHSGEGVFQHDPNWVVDI